MKQYVVPFIRSVVVTPVMLLFLCPIALAQEAKKEEPEKIREYADGGDVFTVAWENDLFGGRDQNYTNGIRASYLSAEDDSNWLHTVGSYLPLFEEDAHKRWGVEVGQSMFTPRDITLSTPQPDDRPYAGWLYTSLSLISDTGYQLDQWQLTLGVVGPASGAAETQKFVHKIVDTRPPRGWKYQLDNEPAGMISYEHKWRGLYEFSPFGWGLDITPSVGGSLGNVYTQAGAGAVARFGYDLPSDYGPPLIKPNIGGTDFFVPAKKLGWYLFAGLEGRVVAQNIFLDGNSFQESPRVVKAPWVGGVQGGLAVTYGDTRMAYTHVFRSKEFKGQEIPDSYGALTVSWRF